MAKYIDAEKARAQGWKAERYRSEPGFCAIERKELTELPGADVKPVVLCKDCEYSYDDILGLCCSYGVCVDCAVPDEFYCAFGKKLRRGYER